MSEDETPIGVDLDAWEPPPPPDGLADAVIARMRAPAAAVARDTVVLDVGTRRRRTWIAGAAVLAVAGAAAAAIVITTRAPADGTGEVVAARARHLALGASAAELDPGAEVRWQRAGRRLAATQPRGAVTWRIADADTLVIDAGAMGASVEATGASLRVEVHMKREIEVTDERARTARTVATSALTAAAVAMVTVVVYEGRVHVTHGGQTVRVEPGATFEVRPVAAPAEQLAVGGGTRDESAAQIAELTARIATLEAEKRELAARVAEQRTVAPPPDDAARPTSDEPRPPSLTRDIISSAVATVKERIRACGGTWSGKLKLKVEVAPDGSVRRADATPDAPPARCVEDVMRAARFAPTDNGGSFSYPFIFAGAPTPCDADALVARGSDQHTAGNYREAHALLEQAYACRPDGRAAQLAFITACKVPDVAKARTAWRRLTAQQQQTTVVMCVRNGISQEALDDGGRAVATFGTAAIRSTPSGLAVLVDGKPAGTTPLTRALPPGTHKVTYLVGDDKLTFTLRVVAGETVTLDKDLE